MVNQKLLIPVSYFQCILIFINHKSMIQWELFAGCLWIYCCKIIMHTRCGINVLAGLLQDIVSCFSARYWHGNGAWTTSIPDKQQLPE